MLCHRVHDELVLETLLTGKLIPEEFTGIVESLEQLVIEDMPRDRFVEQLSQASGKLEVRLTSRPLISLVWSHISHLQKLD